MLPKTCGPKLVVNSSCPTLHSKRHHKELVYRLRVPPTRTQQREAVGPNRSEYQELFDSRARIECWKSCLVFQVFRANHEFVFPAAPSQSLELPHDKHHASYCDTVRRSPLRALPILQQDYDASLIHQASKSQLLET